MNEDEVMGVPYVLWCNSGCRGSWILTRTLTPV